MLVWSSDNGPSTKAGIGTSCLSACLGSNGAVQNGLRLLLDVIQFATDNDFTGEFDLASGMVAGNI